MPSPLTPPPSSQINNFFWLSTFLYTHCATLFCSKFSLLWKKFYRTAKYISQHIVENICFYTLFSIFILTYQYFWCTILLRSFKYISKRWWINLYKKYYFNNNADEHGYHEIHTEDCHYLPALQNQIYIGEFSDCSSAFMNASIRYPDKKFDGCFYCCRTCHKG